MARWLGWVTLLGVLLAPSAGALVPALPGAAELRGELALATPPDWDLVDLVIEAQVDLRTGDPPRLRRRYAATYRLRDDTFRVLASDGSAVVVEPLALAGEVRVIRGLATSTLVAGVWSTELPPPVERLGGIGLPRDGLPAPAIRRGSTAAARFWRAQAERLTGQPAAAAREALVADAVRRRLAAELPGFVEVQALETLEAGDGERRLVAELFTLEPAFIADGREGAVVFVQSATPAGHVLRLRLRALAEPQAPYRVDLVIDDRAALDALGRPLADFAGTPIVRGSPEEQAYRARREVERQRARDAEIAELRRQVEALTRRQQELEQAPPVVERQYVDRVLIIGERRRHRPRLLSVPRLPPR